MLQEMIVSEIETRVRGTSEKIRNNYFRLGLERGEGS